MPTYTYRCLTCPARRSVTRSITEEALPPFCDEHGWMSRDYLTDLPVIHNDALPTRARQGADWRDVLPTTDDFKGPDDPDGTKGLRAWRETHEPRERGGAHPEENKLLRNVT